MKEQRIDALSEILEEIGVKATIEQIKKISEDYALHLEMEIEISSYQFTGGNQECEKCKVLKTKISQKEKEINIYKNSVKRRKGANEVWTDGEIVRYSR